MMKIAKNDDNFPKWQNLLKITKITEKRQKSPQIETYNKQSAPPLHYWLRRPVGFWQVQKVSQSRHLFLIH